MTKRRTTEEFIQLAEQVHKKKYNYSLVNYKNKEEKVDIICPKHGVFSQKPSIHLKGSGCPKCSYIERGLLFRKDKEDFVKESKIIHNNRYTYEDFHYVNSHTKGIINCPKHGPFKQKPNDHLQGRGCPICNISHLELYIMHKLKDYNIQFEVQKQFEWLGKLSLDFFLPDYNIAIECQGKQHFGKGGWVEDFDFDSLYERDKIKNELCSQNGILLLYYCNDLKDINHDLSIYNENNIFDSFDEMVSRNNIGQMKNWKKEFIDFYNSIHDIYHYKDNIAIELCDLTFNSEKYVLPNNNIEKLNAYNKIGKKMICIFEDEWVYHQHIVKSRILNLLKLTQRKIFARKCTIKEMTYQECYQFLNENHLQGATPSKYYLGLFYNNELVSLMSFGLFRKSLGSNTKEGCYELIRFCNKINTEIIGGASKLFHFFITKYSPKEIISYCDIRWSSGDLYKKLGFELLYKSRPNYFYVNQNLRIRENRFKYRKDVLVKNGFDKNKSEHEIMIERGIYRIYDCGCYVFRYKKREG